MFGPCFVTQYFYLGTFICVRFSIAIILMEKRDLVAVF